MTRLLISEPSTSSVSRVAESESNEVKIYQSFMYSVPIFFIIIVAFLLYLFYLYHRRSRMDWGSLRVQASLEDNIDVSRAELGLKKELREMLPIIVYKESFSVNDTQCAVCLGDYQPEERLQQIPACGHTFHMECIDSWLANHITCPLCRLSLLPPAKVPSESQDDYRETVEESHAAVNSGETSVQLALDSCEESQHTLEPQLGSEESDTSQNNAQVEEKTLKSADRCAEIVNARNHTEELENNRDIS
ncbi:hypothetical protein Tsubulata_026903, partial [Turnera subulata]